MKLTYVSVCGFRGYREQARLDFAPGFNVIDGRNGVGKSTIFDAVKFALTGDLSKYAGASQGARMNMFARTAAPFQTEADAAVAKLRTARSVASDETGVRIEGLNAFHWVFRCKDAIVHTPDFTRAAQLVRTVTGGHEPDVWLSDRYSAQQKHGARHQTCLAHLARAIAFADEHGQDGLPSRFKLWFGRAFDLAAGITTFASSTIAAKRRTLESQLDDMLNSPTSCTLARALQAKIGRARHQLLTFCDFPGTLEATNNACERDLRPAVITSSTMRSGTPSASAVVRTPLITAAGETLTER